MQGRGVVNAILDRPLANRILDRYVLPEERIVVATRRHWGVLLEPAATALVSLLLVAAVTERLERAVGDPATLIWWVWLALVARLIWRALEWRNEWFVATDKRLLMTYGLITHKVAMMPLRKVTDMNYVRSPFGRLFGYGQFLLESAGQDQAMRKISWVPQPDNTYRRICDTIFGPGGRDPDEDLDPGEPRERGGARPPRDDGTADRLEEIRQVRERRADWATHPPEEDTEPAWAVSREDAATWTGLLEGDPGTGDDPDITGPIPPPRGRRR